MNRLLPAILIFTALGFVIGLSVGQFIPNKSYLGSSGLGNNAASSPLKEKLLESENGVIEGTITKYADGKLTIVNKDNKSIEFTASSDMVVIVKTSNDIYATPIVKNSLGERDYNFPAKIFLEKSNGVFLVSKVDIDQASAYEEISKQSPPPATTRSGEKVNR